MKNKTAEVTFRNLHALTFVYKIRKLDSFTFLESPHLSFRTHPILLVDIHSQLHSYNSFALIPPSLLRSLLVLFFFTSKLALTSLNCSTRGFPLNQMGLPLLKRKNIYPWKMMILLTLQWQQVLLSFCRCPPLIWGLQCQNSKYTFSQFHILRKIDNLKRCNI